MNTKFVIGIAMVLMVSVGLFMFSDTDESDAVVTASGTCGTDLNWSLEDTGVLTISGDGTNMQVYSTSNRAPWYSYKDSIYSVVFNTPNLTDIRNYAFYNCAIRTVELPSSVQYIYSNAFENTQLTSINLPEGLRLIASRAFANCIGLTSIELPPTLPYDGIESNAFSGCINLKTVINHSGNLTLVKGSTSNGYVAYYADTLINEISGNCGTGLRYTYSDSTQSLVISGEGIGTSNYSTANTPWYKYRDNIFNVEFNTPNLESIDVKFCYGLENISSIILPNHLTTIGSNAFGGCTNLKTVYNLSSNITVVKGADTNGRVGYYADTVYNALASGTCGTNLNWVMWKESAGELIISGDGTVMENPTPSAYGGHASEVTTVTFDATNITTYGNNAFAGCTNLVMTEIPGGITEIGQNAFSGCATITVSEIPATVTNIGPSAFSGCTGITSMSIPSTLTGLGAGAFEGCTALASVYYNAYNNQISAATPFVFAGCTSLSEVTIGENVHVIPNHLFRSVGSLTTVNFDAVDCNELPEGNGAFVGTNVDTIIFGDNVGHIPSYLCKDMSATLESASFNDGLTSIGAHSFDGCSNLVVLALPDTVTDIHSYAFRNCTEVALTDLPSAIDDIGAHAFNGCTGNKINTLPVSLNNIHPYAFENNTGITGLYLPADLDIGIGSNAFLGCTNLKEILNLSAMEIEKGSTDNGYIAYYADAVADNFDDLAIIQQKEFVEHEVIEKTDATSTVLRIIPILIVLSITLGFIGMNPFTKRRTY